MLILEVPLLSKQLYLNYYIPTTFLTTIFVTTTFLTKGSFTCYVTDF